MRLQHLTAIAGLALLATSLSAPAMAQDQGPAKVQEIKAVERGFFMGADFGLSYLIAPDSNSEYGLGTVIGFFMGYDISPVINLSLGVNALAAGGTRSTPQRDYKADLLYLTPSLRAQVALLTTERNFLWVRGEAGYAFALPEEVDGAEFGKPGPAFAVMAGYERFAKLRHFSLGVSAGAHIFLEPQFTLGISVMPMVKYTF